MARIRVAGHFGEFLQGRLGPDGPLALVTLPCDALGVSASFEPGAGPLRVRQEPAPILSEEIIRSAIGTGGTLSFVADAPPGAGTGASTAALLCLAALADVPQAERAAFCLDREGATDPLMHADPARLVWAPREARVIEELPAPPAFDVVGGFHGPPRVTDPADTDFPDLASLVEDWRRAAGDPATLAALAARSADRTEAHRGGSRCATLKGIAAATGAPGYAIAHTGCAGALLFPPGAGGQAHAAAELERLGWTGIIRFRTGGVRA